MTQPNPDTPPVDGWIGPRAALSWLLALATVALLGMAVFVFGRRFGDDLISGVRDAELIAFGVLTLWVPVFLLAAPFVRRGGVR